MAIICLAILCNYVYIFWDILQRKNLSTDLHFLSGDTTLNIDFSLQLKWDEAIANALHFKILYIYKN